jgi:hypothetical protein
VLRFGAAAIVDVNAPTTTLKSGAGTIAGTGVLFNRTTSLQHEYAAIGSNLGTDRLDRGGVPFQHQERGI